MGFQFYRARDGRAVRLENYLYSEPGRTYVFPPGKYRLAFFLRPVDPSGFNHIVLRARVIPSADSSSAKTYRKVRKINNKKN